MNKKGQVAIMPMTTSNRRESNMAKAKSSVEPFDLEAALVELNQLVEQMEQGGSSLEESLKNFERGIALTRACQTALKTAEQKVQLLLEQNGRPTLTSFDEQMEDK